MVGTASLILLAYAVTWSAFPSVLTWRHSQLIAGATGGMWLILLRLVAPNPNGIAAGQTPLAIAMTALLGTVALALPISHPEAWSAASIVLMLTGVITWLWYPPQGMSPFRIARQTTLSMGFALLSALTLELFGVSPWRHNPVLTDLSRPISGPFDRSETLTGALIALAVATMVALWTTPDEEVRTRRVGRVLVVLLIAANALFAPPISVGNLALIVLSIAVGVASTWRLAPTTTTPESGAKRRWTLLLIAALLVSSAFSAPLSTSETTLRPQLHNPSPLIDTLDPSWQVADPLVPELKDQLALIEWKAAARNLPFGSGVGTWFDETVGIATSVYHLPESMPPNRQAGWPDQPRSFLAAAITEMGIIAAFVWAFFAVGGFLLTRLIVRTRAFPRVLAIFSGSAPILIVGFLPGASHPFICLALLLNWFLLSAPLANHDIQDGKRIVPRESTLSDTRRAPRGRILIIAVPALIVGWFSMHHTRWTRQSAMGYAEAARGNLNNALTHFERANRFLPHPATLYNEALLFEALHPNSDFDHALELYRQALRRRPHSSEYLVARTQTHLREHALLLASQGPLAANRKNAAIEASVEDLQQAIRLAPHWGTPRRLLTEVYMLLAQRDNAIQVIRTAESELRDPVELALLHFLEARIAATLDDDPMRALQILEGLENGPNRGTLLLQVGMDHGRIQFWIRTGESPFQPELFHEGHEH